MNHFEARLHLFWLINFHLFRPLPVTVVMMIISQATHRQPAQPTSADFTFERAVRQLRAAMLSPKPTKVTIRTRR